MKRILVYGDSNTWGAKANDTGRLDDSKQWPQILQANLGDSYKIVQEGLCGRIAGNFEENKAYYNGQASFEVIFRSATPVNVLIIALGTNDLKRRYNRTPKQIQHDLLWYTEKTQQLQSSNEGVSISVLYILPPNFTSTEGYYEANQQTRIDLIDMFKGDDSVLIFDDLEMTEDGVHFSELAHTTVANAVGKKIEESYV